MSTAAKPERSFILARSARCLAVALVMLTLSGTVAAKCADPFVVVEGTAEGAGENDESVMLVLVYSSSEIEIGKRSPVFQDGKFRVISRFASYSGSGIFRADICKRHPKTVVLALLDGDGAPLDEVVLHWRKDFQYGNGEYKNTAVTLKKEEARPQAESPCPPPPSRN